MKKLLFIVTGLLILSSLNAENYEERKIQLEHEQMLIAMNENLNDEIKYQIQEQNGELYSTCKAYSFCSLFKKTETQTIYFSAFKLENRDILVLKYHFQDEKKPKRVTLVIDGTKNSTVVYKEGDSDLIECLISCAKDTLVKCLLKCILSGENCVFDCVKALLPCIISCITEKQTE